MPQAGRTWPWHSGQALHNLSNTSRTAQVPSTSPLAFRYTPLQPPVPSPPITPTPARAGRRRDVGRRRVLRGVPPIVSTRCCSPAPILSTFPSQRIIAACSPYNTGGGKEGEEPGLAAIPAENVPWHHGAATSPQRTRHETKPSGSCCCCRRCFRRPKATRREINDSESS